MALETHEYIVIESAKKRVEVKHGMPPALDFPCSHSDPYAFSDKYPWPSANRAIYVRNRGFGTLSKFRLFVGLGGGANVQLGIYLPGGNPGLTQKAGTAVARSAITALSAGPDASQLIDLVAETGFAVPMEVYAHEHWLGVWCNTAGTGDSTTPVGPWIVGTKAYTGQFGSGMVAIESSLTGGLPAVSASQNLGSQFVPLLKGE